MLMNTENQSFQTILGNGAKYQVPQFQRDYSWESEQWDDLWADIESLDEEKQHYMGYVVLQSSAANARHLIIDGQQRLTTLSIIVLSTLKRLAQLAENNKGDEKRAEIIRNTYIGTFDSVSLNTYNKLELNRNNASSFKKLCSLQNLPSRKIKKTNQLMNRAFDWFYDRLSKKTGEALAEFIEKMAKGLIFTKITVSDELNAYKVFETLNARGVQLSTPDLLKNYLFSIISSHGDVTDQELERLDERWEGIVNQLGNESFTGFIHTDWNGRYKHTKKNVLFKNIRQQINTREQAYTYLDIIERRCEVYTRDQ